MPFENLTKEFVDKLPYTEGGKQAIYRDTRLEGFCVRVTSSGKSYIVVKTVKGGKQVSFTLGRCGQLKHDEARRLAGDVLNSMTKGVNPVAELKAARAKGVTLGEVFESFLETRNKLKPRTVKDYTYHMQKRFADWLERPIREITKDMIGRRHKALTENHGPAQANQGFRYLRSIFNFAMGRYENAKGRSLIHENPVSRLSQTRAWNQVGRKRTYIKDSDLPSFYNALDALRGELADSKKTTEIVPDYLELILFTGLRRQEAARLKWEEVDLQARTFTITDTKNHHPLTLPMSDRIYNIFKKRYETNLGVGNVFPGEGKAGYLVEPKRQMKKIIALSGVKFSIHDLRRTFATVAESLDISYSTLKRLLNHKQAGDVTAGYVVHDVERLRLPMQRITDAILTRAGRKGGADVLPFRKIL